MLFKIAKNMELYFFQNQSWAPVDLKPCFPNSFKDKYFSIRDKDGKEVYLIESLAQLEEINRKTIIEYLKFKTFRFEIVGIHRIEEDFGVRHFEVKTNKGDRNFQTNLDDWPTIQKDGSILIDDLFGDQYCIYNLKFGQKLISDYIS
ncbi:MAG: hypothetical protein ACJAS4_003605 [Bacteriovoracaceae bacterium]|jgi:hypothetical protein